MTAWIVIVVVGIGTYAMRASLIVLFGRVEAPPLVERASRYVAPAVLAAIVLPGLVAPDGQVDLRPVRLAAGAVAALVAFWTKSIPATLAVGLGVFVLLDLVL